MLQACMKYQNWGRDSRDHYPALVPPKATKDPFVNLWIESQEGLTDLLCLFTLWYTAQRDVQGLCGVLWQTIT